MCGEGDVQSINDEMVLRVAGSRDQALDLILAVGRNERRGERERDTGQSLFATRGAMSNQSLANRDSIKLLNRKRV